MNSDFEIKIIKKFFSSRSAERLIYEAAKKRERFFDKLSHTCEEYLQQEVIADKSNMPHNEADILKFLSDKKCYIMAMNSELDGEYARVTAALNSLYRNGSPYLIISADGKKAYLETEYNFSEHCSYFLSTEK